MSVTAISSVFDRILALSEGEVLLLNFPNENDLKSKKTLLFREKLKYEKAAKRVAKGICIRQVIAKKTGTYQLRISTSGTALDWLENAVIVEKGGDIRPADIGTEDDRISKLRPKEK